MPTNVSPDYKRAESVYKQAREPEERLECLREMLRTIPKHKGTEHLQSDIKSRIKQLSAELKAPRKGGARGGPLQVVRPEGAAQVALLGPTNAGKSELHASLTGSNAEIGPYPFTTHEPLPGMLPFEDINFQLVDLPPLTRERPVPWIGNALQPTDACLLVVDLQDPDCIDSVLTIRELLAERRITLTADWSRPGEHDTEDADIITDPFAITLPTLMIVAKIDLMTGRDAELAAFHELLGTRFPAIEFSVRSREGIDSIGGWLFEKLEIVRVYTKVPGKPIDTQKPYTVFSGDTVHDVAVQVHRDLADTLRFARLWGVSGQFDGQQVSRNHLVRDGDVLELH